MSKKSKWTKAEKLQAIEILQSEGASVAARKFGVSSTSIYKWRDKYEQLGPSAFDGQAHSNKDKEILDLKRQLEQYKSMVAEKELTIRIQQDMLKKSR